MLHYPVYYREVGGWSMASITTTMEPVGEGELAWKWPDRPECSWSNRWDTQIGQIGCNSELLKPLNLIG